MTPSFAERYIDRSDAVNLARNALDPGVLVSQFGIERLAKAVLEMDAELTRLYSTDGTDEQSETPRTDALLQKLDYGVFFNREQMLEHARRLERELAHDRALWNLWNKDLCEEREKVERLERELACAKSATLPIELQPSEEVMAAAERLSKLPVYRWKSSDALPVLGLVNLLIGHYMMRSTDSTAVKE